MSIYTISIFIYVVIFDIFKVNVRCMKQYNEYYYLSITIDKSYQISNFDVDIYNFDTKQ